MSALSRRRLAGVSVAGLLGPAAAAVATPLPVASADQRIADLHQVALVADAEATAAFVLMDRQEFSEDPAEQAKAAGTEAAALVAIERRDDALWDMAEIAAAGLTGVCAKAYWLAYAARKGQSQVSRDVAKSLQADIACLAPQLATAEGRVRA